MEIPDLLNGNQIKAFALNAFYCAPEKNFTPITRTLTTLGGTNLLFSECSRKPQVTKLLPIAVVCRWGRTFTLPLIFSSFHCSVLNLPDSGDSLVYEANLPSQECFLYKLRHNHQEILRVMKGKNVSYQ